jgi:hypothetical protein
MKKLMIPFCIAILSTASFAGDLQTDTSPQMSLTNSNNLLYQSNSAGIVNNGWSFGGYSTSFWNWWGGFSYNPGGKESLNGKSMDAVALSFSSNDATQQIIAHNGRLVILLKK